MWNLDHGFEVSGMRTKKKEMKLWNMRCRERKSQVFECVFDAMRCDAWCVWSKNELNEKKVQKVGRSECTKGNDGHRVLMTKLCCRNWCYGLEVEKRNGDAKCEAFLEWLSTCKMPYWFQSINRIAIIFTPFVLFIKPRDKIFLLFISHIIKFLYE